MNAYYELLLGNRMSYPHAASLTLKVARMERDVAEAHVPQEILDVDASVANTAFARYRYMSGFEKTSVLVNDLALCLRARELAGHLEPSRSRYAMHPLLTEIWELRQRIDRLGIPYSYYVHNAVAFWIKQGRKNPPRARDLMAEDISSYVAALWNNPIHRVSYPLYPAKWDRRFAPDNFVGDGPQLELLRLIEQRVNDIQVMGGEPSHALALLLGRGISRTEAIRRFGNELVRKAEEYRQTEDGRLADVLTDL